MKICICDDDIEVLDSVGNQIQQLLHDNDKIIKVSNIKDLKKVIDTDLDVLFVDVQLQDTNSIDFIKKNAELLKNTIIIYITGYDEYIEDAFDTDFEFFLRKPINIEKIKKAFNKIAQKNEKNNNYISIKNNKQVHIVNTSSILYIESDNRILKFFLENKEIITTYSKLSEVIKKLPSTFLKVHKSFVINIEKIKSYKTNEITLVNNKKIPISRLNKDKVKDNIIRYINTAN